MGLCVIAFIHDHDNTLRSRRDCLTREQKHESELQEMAKLTRSKLRTFSRWLSHRCSIPLN